MTGDTARCGHAATFGDGIAQPGGTPHGVGEIDLRALERKGELDVGRLPSLSHSRWNGTYPVVFVPKRRRKTRFGKIRKALAPIFHELARQKACRIIEGHLIPDHVHICIEIPPKYSVASVIG